MNSGLVLCPLDSAVASPRGRLAEEAVSPHYLQSEMYFQIEPCKKAVQSLHSESMVHYKNKDGMSYKIVHCAAYRFAMNMYHLSALD